MLVLTEANANRTDGLLTVTLVGQLDNPFEEVIELGHYPGNGFEPARIFLGIRRKPELENGYCLRGTRGYWNLRRVIPGSYSRCVEIFINDQLVKIVRVIEFTGHGSYLNY